MMKRSLLIGLLLVLAPSVSQAADDEMRVEDSAEAGTLVAVPDRPTFSAAAASVPGGHAQLEAGAEYASEDGASQLAFPVLLRLGVAPSFELRAGLPAPVIPLGDEETELGSLQLGAKVAGEVAESLSLGAMPFFDIASSSGDSTVFSQSTYGFMGLWGHSITDAFSIGGNVGASVGPGATEESAPRELFYAASLAASYSFGAVATTLEGFAVFGEFADTTVGGSVSAGYAITERLIVDVYGGSSAAGSAQTLFAGTGVTYLR